ncbi:acetyl-CoA carboxylase biotin carboxyl carrier protein [candidate division KSB1 bacterium]|nr:acetyl-CoA carboxylase biotin carboxyl carrier protein [candidate division KSB1 bacterium]NIR68998.1 acetyl-CoA carboxylase biotin carboxyl carrier protein [candidate division KSB1 bacterium]NIS24073.1 acetyl-CoA carboxylase biotin carboxyl carrier protein [candidate division KSB1 bacterium]NIT70992.1 acetyl-CoA carboxylase biotin carboxyl carrier protein [candidate division KSB1 bacterium]NIU27403.1 acetyl-CoA carboxylase biotin carboxyl carrier protein [candidate division KSB1 bacterium]
MKEDEIKRLVKIVEESNIGELEISRWGRTIRISKTVQNSNSYGTPSSQVYQVPTTPPQPEAQLGGGEGGAERGPDTAKTAGGKTAEIKAPMVGTFYRAPAPDADPYVDVNHVVKKGQVLCIIEAMKLMNEIESEYDGRIVEVLVENGQPVEYNQPLFQVEMTA